VPRTTITEIQALKTQGRKIVAATAYDYEIARILEGAGVDILLVGDSGARHALGILDIEVTVDEMILLTRSVSNGAKRALVVGDMPFMSYQVSVERAIENAGRYFKEARADAVKLEGGEDIAPTVKALVRAGIPVMGHMGLTPQTAMAFGRNFMSKDAQVAVDQIRRDALALSDAGAFALVLTRVPPDTAKQLSLDLPIPMLAGGGAGDDCDGQVCVTHGVLGLRIEEVEAPRAAYGPVAVALFEAAQRFCADVRDGKPVRARREAPRTVS
jgi:3-methyl-2-oxobutanoate hydroxymethyltransferase